ncbi:uncharacterized protein [Linepithema humile]|uniref:uncharacterized protein isoform X1 n=2 Tax=Linepithema humile TaxID=83485 RepID=UPI00351F29C1
MYIFYTFMYSIHIMYKKKKCIYFTFILYIHIYIYFFCIFRAVTIAMSYLINSADTILLKEDESSLHDVYDNGSNKKSVFIAKTHTEDDIAQWFVVYFESDEEEDIESFNDLIPSSWITSSGTLSWYPMNEHQATIHKLVKQCAKPNLKWNCFSIKKIEENIENYDRGMKMLVKIAKNPNATLYSDMEEKGKGKRLKRANIKYFDDLEENNEERNKENNFEKKRNMQLMLPPLPKLKKPTRESQPLSDKMNKKVKQLCRDKASSSLDNNEQLPSVVSDEINIPHTVPENKSYMERKGLKLLKERSFVTEMHKPTSATIASEEICKFVDQISGCKIRSKINHKCAYTLEGTVTLESLADAICHFNAEISSCKLILRKTDKNVESFLETQTINKPETNNPAPITVQDLDEFPLTNLDDLKKIERRLKKDETFHLKMVEALHLQIKGESIQKQVNSVLRMILHDTLASLFNWKGQRGTKLKLAKRRISKIMIEAVAKEFPIINETMFGRKAGPWLAQASFRIKKYMKKDNEIHSNNDESSENESFVNEESNEDSE